MKKLLIGQLIVSLFVLGPFFWGLSFDGNVERALVLVTVIVGGAAGGAFLGLFAPYAIGAAAAIFLCSLTQGFALPTVGSFVCIFMAYVFATKVTGRLNTNSKVLLSSNAVQFVVVLIPMMVSIQKG